MKRALSALSLLALLAAAGPAPAHHSYAPYDIRNRIELAGVAENFVYRRPHPLLTLVDAEELEWEIEVPLQFWDRAGLGPDAIRAGDALVVYGWPARNGKPEMVLSGFELRGKYFSVVEEIRQRSAVEAANEADRNLR